MARHPERLAVLGRHDEAEDLTSVQPSLALRHRLRTTSEIGVSDEIPDENVFPAMNVIKVS